MQNNANNYNSKNKSDDNDGDDVDVDVDDNVYDERGNDHSSRWRSPFTRERAEAKSNQF